MHTMYLDTPEQVRALGHPLRLQILDILGTGTMTNQQIAEQLSQPPAKTHFHVTELRKAGLVELTAETPKGGVIEKYYRATARHYQLGPALHHRSDQDTLLDAAINAARTSYERSRQDTDREPALQIVQATATLTPSQAARIRTHLDAIAAELDAAHDAHSVNAVQLSITCIFHEQPT